MTAVVIRGDARHLPLPDASVDLIVTSPPYFGLRSYTDGGAHYAGQIGSEATPGEWVDALVACTAEWVRVLKPQGSMFINLGDKYATAPAGNKVAQGIAAQRPNWAKAFEAQRADRRGHAKFDVPTKSLLGLPWRYALACTDQLGLILRRDIVWHKPNGLPESVTDRCRSSHEYVFHMTKQARYYAAVDEIREPHAEPPRSSYGRERPVIPGGNRGAHVGLMPHAAHRDMGQNPLGKLPGSVWSIHEGESLVRLILRAVADDAITIDEAERLIRNGIWWPGSSDSTPRLNEPTAAGTGSAHWTPKATGTTAAPTTTTGQSTASPTNYGSAPSPLASQSTTSAATGDASTLPTSKPSPSARTSAEDAKPPRPTASTGTSSPLPTPTAGPADAGSAGHVYDSESAITTHGDVWSIPSQPLQVPPAVGVDHYAAFPMELPRRVIAGWSPPGICTGCGEGRRPVTTSTYTVAQNRYGNRFADGLAANGTHGKSRPGSSAAPDLRRQVDITGYVCACPTPDAPTRPSVILDPFGGTGTTALVASVLGRHGISTDLSADYCRLATWRTNDPAQRAAAMQVPKPPPIPDGMETLF